MPSTAPSRFVTSDNAVSSHEPLLLHCSPQPGPAASDAPRHDVTTRVRSPEQTPLSRWLVSSASRLQSPRPRWVACGPAVSSPVVGLARMYPIAYTSLARTSMYKYTIRCSIDLSNGTFPNCSHSFAFIEDEEVNDETRAYALLCPRPRLPRRAWR